MSAGLDRATAALRPWTVQDAPALRDAVAQSPDLATQLGGAALRTVEDCADYITAHLLDRGLHAITVDGVAVSTVGISHLDPRHDTAWTSYWLTASARGRGLATRAVATVARWAFDELGLFRLELGHRVNNPASCRVATAAGFTAEGIERAKLRYGAERFDVETHARLRTDPRPEIEPLALAR
ncbi:MULTISPECIES: GNAT family N-acetyltransferase [unclassified Actinotalea]|uniref:GNAT family N-acetyltransferase n=1 Tax=unclassified Actinotalea TaxID=2638618 RepID=UPI0015F3E1A4|nr:MULTISPECIES: GNAT family protein [unclassified Actinotalea]